MQKNTPEPAKLNRKVLFDDVLIITIMAVLAGCGLIYEYLLSHYAARVLGAVETTIFIMIGLMIVAMGLGSFAAKKLKQPFTGFAWLELAIALIGISSVLIIALAFAFAHSFPQIIAETYGLPPDLKPSGGFFETLQKLASLSPYIAGFLLGFLVGIEIPLIARIRETIYEKSLTHNAGTIYGADYIGAGIGAAIWVAFMLSMEITTAAALTASANLLAGIVFYARYHKKIKLSQLYLIAHLVLIVVVLNVLKSGEQWEATLENTLYKDQVIFSAHTHYQHITVTERTMDPQKSPVYSLFINGRTQFSSIDENVYHEMLVHPVLAASAKQQNILIIGGGDGLAAREVLKWNPKQITMLELDESMIEFFRQEKFDEERGKVINKPLLELNAYALSDPRMKITFGDAFNQVDELLNNNQLFDAIIVDLPDPSHPDLNKLYSDRFYLKLRHLLTGDGAIIVQSTSPYHAKNAFLSIGKTMKHAGFLHVEQMHQNVPSFGEWGWSIATKNGQSALTRLKQNPNLPVKTSWLTNELMLGAFHFPAQYFSKIAQIKVNTLNSHVLYEYHQTAWQQQQGIFAQTSETN